MEAKLLVVIALTILALALLAAVVNLGKKLDASAETKDVVTKLISLIKVITTVIALTLGGAAVTFLMPGCTAQRSITVQGTVVQSRDSDSTRVIISSQEKYTGRKKASSN